MMKKIFIFLLLLVCTKIFAQTVYYPGDRVFTGTLSVTDVATFDFKGTEIDSIVVYADSLHFYVGGTIYKALQQEYDPIYNASVASQISAQDTSNYRAYIDDSTNVVKWSDIASYWDSTKVASVIEDSVKKDIYYIDFDTTQIGLPYKQGRKYYDNVKKNWVAYNDRPNTALDEGREGRLRAINATGETVANGKVVRISGDASGIKEFMYANAKYDSTALGTIGFTTEEIAPGDTGEITLWGDVNFLNTLSIQVRSNVYLDTIDGGITTSIVSSPSWIVFMGVCARSHATEGIINTRVDIRTNTNDVLKIFNGSILESNEITVISNGTNIYLKLYDLKNFLTLFYDSQPYKYTIPDSIILNAGSDTNPTRNYVYIPKSTKQLTVSTSGFPTNEQYVPIADVLCQTASSAQTYGVYKVHVWTDHLSDEVGQGHLTHVNKWIRNQNATWLTGVVPSVSVGTNLAGLDTVRYSNTSGQVLQLHPHLYPSVDLQSGGHAHVINDQTTPYTIIYNLGTISTDTEGNSLRGNNTYYSLVVWGSISEDSLDCQLFINKPSGFYTSLTENENDASNYSIYTIPSEYKGTGFLIAKVNLRYQTINGGTFIVTSVDDLRGRYPATSSGGSSVTPSSGSFADNSFEIFNISDATKKLAFNVANVSTGTTRTLTVPNVSGTIATLDVVSDSTDNARAYTDAQIIAYDDTIPKPPGGTAAILLQNAQGDFGIDNSFRYVDDTLFLNRDVRVANFLNISTSNTLETDWQFTGSGIDYLGGVTGYIRNSGTAIYHYTNSLMTLDVDLDIGTNLIEGVSAAEFSYLDGTTSDIQTQFLGKEPSLGNPVSNGYVLSSTTGGIRSWVAQSGSSVDTTYNGTTSIATDYRVDSAKVNIRSEIPTNNNQLTNGAGYITSNQTITLSGDVTGSGTTSITASVVDDSHNHVISNIDNLSNLVNSTATSIEVDDSAKFNGNVFSPWHQITYATSITFDGNNSVNQYILLTGNVTTCTFSNMKPGGTYIFDVIQDATGGRTFSEINLDYKANGSATFSTTSYYKNKFVINVDYAGNLDYSISTYDYTP